jgi:2-oxoglutarate/2-oxoacid ferredoxin oxidoreductase subunit alpha
MSSNNNRPVLEDVNVIVAGQGGDGSLTVITMLAEMLRMNGLNVYTERDVLSRIRGGHAAATMRAFTGDRYCIGSNINLLVALDEEAVEKNARQLDSKSIVVYDDSGGPVPSVLPQGTRVYSAPFNRIAMRTMRRELYKNSIAFGLVGRLLGLEDESLRETFISHFQRMGQVILEYNLEALSLGFHLADEMGIHEGEGLYKIKKTAPEKRMIITGNESVSFGFMVAGGRFFCGYPITPSSEILETLQKWLPRCGGVARQTEDELAGINMALGAALTGTRAMVATSGPGFSLMQEGVGHSGSGEIPLVIVDCQRSGPSTGMPTKPEQSDLNLMVFGGHGDFPRIVLAPGHPEDCFYLTVDATNLADKYQCPVYLAMDQALSQNIATVEPFDLDGASAIPGKRMSASDIEKHGMYKRYEFTEDNVSAFAAPGTPGGMSLVTGNEHNEWGLVSTDPVNRVKMMNKRMGKIEHAKSELPRARHFGDKSAKIGFIGIGSLFGVIMEAMEDLKREGINTAYLQPRTVWPVLEDILGFIDKCSRVYVVELNAQAQLAHILMHQGADPAKIINILKYDGIPFRPAELAKRVLEQEGRMVKKGKKEAKIQ